MTMDKSVSNSQEVFSSEEMMHLAVEASPNGMVLTNGEGNIVLVNSATEKLFGYQRQELIGQSLNVLIPERFRKHHPRLSQDYYRNPSPRAMGQGRNLYGLHKNGSEVPIEIGLNPIKTQNSQYVLAAIVDISDRRHAEEMMTLAVEASPNGMAMIDAMGKIVLVNSMTETLFVYSRDELIGQSIEILVPERFRSAHPYLREDYLKKPKTRAMGQGRDLYGLRKDGTEFSVEIGLNPIATHNGSFVLASIVDITERKRQEERLRDALKEKDLLLAEIHHRVKNNLQIIDSLLGMQSDQVSDPSAVSILVESQNRVKSMSLIHQTLYESLDFSSVDMASVTRSLVNHLSQSYALDSSRFQLNIEVGNIQLPIDISIPLGLIINELCSNAMKHAFQGRDQGVINISLLRLNDNQVELIVSDDGIGITEEFDIENTNSLGLQLIQLLSEQINGTLDIHRRNPTMFVVKFDVPE